MNHLLSSTVRRALTAGMVAMSSHAWCGGMLLSNSDRSLAINAWGGARDGTILRLHNGCRPDNPDCTWTYKNGMLISDRSPDLAISASAQHGAELRLRRGCSPSNPECVWTYRGGMFVSNADPSLAINAWGGARYGTQLRLHNACRPDNPDCTWSR